MRLAIPLLGLLLAALPAAAQAPDGLFAAARAGDVEALGRQLDAGVPVDAGDRWGNTALAMAASAGHAGAVRLLLDRGADPNVRERFYDTGPLAQAMFNERWEVARLLLERGAEGREEALDAAFVRRDLELARAALAGGPIHRSKLADVRRRAATLPGLAELLDGATERPDPEIPAYAVAELHELTGVYEGWTSETRCEVVLREGRLRAAVDGGAFATLEPAAGRRTFAAAGGLGASFSGRAGTIEGLVLRRPGAMPEYLRRSVAEPAPAAASGSRGARPAAGDAVTVHWPAFRGANAAGVGDGLDVPVRWSLESGENVRWQAELPGLGNSSPVVWGERVFVTTAVAAGLEQKLTTGLTGAGTNVDESVEHSWRVLAFDKASGELLWDREVGRAVPLTRRHFKASQASSTPVTDGERLVVVFPTAGLAALDLDGNVLWRHELGRLNAGAFSDPGQEWGFASSPVLYDGKVILQVDVHEGAYLAAWDLASGQRLWRVERQVAPSWATPTLLATPDGPELIVNGSTIHGYDPRTGEELWSLGPNSELVIATPVAGEGVVYVSAGYPPVKPIYAVRAGGREAVRVEPGEAHPRLAWSHARGGAYMPTPLLYRGLLYVVHHNGRLVAYDAATGAPLLKSRFSRGGAFTGSPVAVNGRLYVPTEEGLVYVLAAGSEYEELAVNETGEPLMATPAVSQGTLFLRTPTRLIAVGADRAE